jgi:hypothetical protein
MTSGATSDRDAKFKPGDRVYIAGSISGTYAEFALCKTAQVHPLPASASFAHGAAVDASKRKKEPPFRVTFRLKSGNQVASILLLITPEIGVSA